MTLFYVELSELTNYFLKALTWYESSDRFNVNNQNRCRELAVRASYDLMKRRYYENAADPSQNPTWLQRGGER